MNSNKIVINFENYQDIIDFTNIDEHKIIKFDFFKRFTYDNKFDFNKFYINLNKISLLKSYDLYIGFYCVKFSKERLINLIDFIISNKSIKDNLRRFKIASEVINNEILKIITDKLLKECVNLYSFKIRTVNQKNIIDGLCYLTNYINNTNITSFSICESYINKTLMNSIINLINNNKLNKLRISYCSFEDTIEEFNVLSKSLINNVSLQKLYLPENNLNESIINIVNCIEKRYEKFYNEKTDKTLLQKITIKETELNKEKENQEKETELNQEKETELNKEKENKEKETELNKEKENKEKETELNQEKNPLINQSFNPCFIHLNLSKNLINNETFEIICSKLHHIKHLDLSNNSDLTFIDPIYIFIKNNKHLTYLKLSEINAVDFNPLINALKTNNTLTHLDINSNQLNLNSLVNLYSLIKINKSIKHLYLNNIYFSDYADNSYGQIEFIKNICNSLKQNNLITDINLSFNNVDNEGYNSIIDLINTSKTLKILNISSVNQEYFTQEQFNNLCNSLKQNTTLEYINIYGCLNYELNFEHFYETLMINKNIKQIGIENFLIRDKINIFNKIEFINNY